MLVWALNATLLVCLFYQALIIRKMNQTIKLQAEVIENYVTVLDDIEKQGPKIIYRTVKSGQSMRVN